MRGLAGGRGLPITEVYVEFLPPEDPDGEVREVVGIVSVRSSREARTLLVLTRLLVIGALNSAGIAFDEIPESLSVERRENLILLDGLYLREAQIARLFMERVPLGGAP